MTEARAFGHVNRRIISPSANWLCMFRKWSTTTPWRFTRQIATVMANSWVPFHKQLNQQTTQCTATCSLFLFVAKVLKHFSFCSGVLRQYCVRSPKNSKKPFLGSRIIFWKTQYLLLTLDVLRSAKVGSNILKETTVFSVHSILIW